MRRKLNKQIVTATKSDGHEILIWDTEVPGLGLRVTGGGAKSFILKMRIGGGRGAPIKKPTLCKVGDLTLDQARSKAREWKALAKEGTDPARHKKVSGRTVADLCAEYLEVHAPRKRSADDDKAKIRTHILPRFGRMLIKDVSFSDVERLHRSMKKVPYAANRTLALISKMFALAIQWEWAERNPVKGIERYPEEKRVRFLSPKEISRLLEALIEYEETARRPEEARMAVNALRLLMLTGARRTEVFSMTWAMVDIEQAVWTKPSSHTKQKKTHRIPLSPPALKLLMDIKENTVDEMYVFPSGRNSKTPHITELKKAWSQICKIANIDNIRIHDLRHTYASILVSGGSSLPLIGALLGHTQVQTTQRYAHLMDDPLREATNRAAVVIEGNDSTKVINMGDEKP